MRYVFVFSLLCLLPLAPLRAETSCSIADNAMEIASGIRGLRISKAVPCKIQDRTAVERYLREKISQDYPVEKLRGEERLYKLIGIIPLDYDYVNGLIKLYTDQLGGYYDPEKDFYVMASWMPEMLQMSIAVHELTHALQDQHFNLDSMHGAARDSSDLLLARSGLIEGDATAVMLDYSRQLSGQPPLVTEKSVLPFMAQNLAGAALSPSLHEAPSALQSLLIFPYLSGLNFVHGLLQTGGYQAVNKAFRSPPETTEEILHPEKYLKRRDGEFRRFPNPPLKGNDGAEVVYADEFGEFGVSTLLSTYVPPQEASKAASGWGGDRVALYRVEDQKEALVWRTAWDSEEDAQEFFATIATAYGKRFTITPTTGNGTERILWGSPIGTISIVKSGLEVEIVITPT